MGIKNADASGDGLLIQAGDASDDYALRVEDYDSANDLFVVRGDGNCGIGINAPETLLHIKGDNARIAIQEDDDEFMVIGIAPADESDNWIAFDDSTDLHIGMLNQVDDTSLDTIMTINASRYVGIGTATPGSLLQVHNNTSGGTSAIQISARNDGISTLLFGETDGSDPNGGGIEYRHVSYSSAAYQDSMLFRLADSYKMAIDSSGKLGLGILTPAVMLDILDTPSSSSSQGASLRLGSNDGAVMGSGHRLGVIEFARAEDTSSTMTVGARIEAVTDATGSSSENGAALEFYTTDGNATQTKRLSLDADGSVQFSATVYGDNVGTGRDLRIVSGGGIGYDASSRIFKTNIESLTDISWLYNLNPVTFNFKKKDDNGNILDEVDTELGKNYGFIAEEVGAIEPNLCFKATDDEKTKHGTDYMSVKYDKMVAVLVKAVQELSAKVTALESA